MVPPPDTSGTGEGVPPPSLLRVVDFGGPELTATLGDGTALAEAIAHRDGHAPTVEIRRAPAGPLDEILASWSTWADLLDGAHVAVRSISPDVEAGLQATTATECSPGRLAELGEQFRASFGPFAQAVKAAGITVVAVNGSTVDPHDQVFSYADAGVSPSLVVHQLDLELIRMSMLEGVSVLDTDRVVSQLGGASHVPHLMAYDEVVAAGVVAELALILEEYGWFDDRPILAQRGQRDREAVG
jgi:hypothetical protein